MRYFKRGCFSFTSIYLICMMMAACAAILSMPRTSSAQEEERRARHTIYLEGLGPAVGHSINYEYAFSDPYRLRVGFSPCRHQEGCWSGDFTYSTGHLTVLASRLFRHEDRGKDGFEAGGGLTLAEGPTENAFRGDFPPTDVYGILLIGYRYQPIAGGMVFRIGWTPVIGFNDSDETSLFWGGLSLGYAF